MIAPSFEQWRDMRRVVQELIEALPTRSHSRRRQVLVGVQNHQSLDFIALSAWQAVTIPPAVWRGLNPRIAVIIVADAGKPLCIGEQPVVVVDGLDTERPGHDRPPTGTVDQITCAI